LNDVTWQTACIPAILICLAVLIVAAKMQLRKDRELHEATCGKHFDYAPGKITDQPVVTSVEDGPAWGRGNPQPARARWSSTVMLSGREKETLAQLERTTGASFWDLFQEQTTQTDQGELPDMNISRSTTNETLTAPAPQADPFPTPAHEYHEPWKGIKLEPHTGETQQIKTPPPKTPLPWFELPKED
jgi:hypothetical protein